MKASVVVVSRDRKGLLERALLALLNQTFARANYEVIVIDDGSTDGTKELIGGLMQKYKNLHYFNQGKKGLAAGRNKGAKISKAEVVAFTDDDCIAEKNWLSELIKPFSDRVVVGVEGKVIAGRRKLFYNAPENLNGGSFIGCNLAFRKNIISKSGFFDEEIGIIRDDTDFAFKALKLGRIAFSPDAVINHPPRRVDYFSVIRNLRFVKNDFILFRRFPKEYIAFFGFPLQKDIIFSIVSWLLFIIFLYSVLSLNVLLFFLSIIFAALWKSLQVFGKGFTARDLVAFLFLSFLRDLIFPFVFIYYFFTVVPKA